MEGGQNSDYQCIFFFVFHNKQQYNCLLNYIFEMDPNYQLNI